MSKRGSLPGLRALSAAAIALVTSLTSGYAAAQEDYQISPEGHSFRVRFDPESRIRVGIAEALGLGGAKDGAASQAPEVTAGISYRQMESKGVGRDRVVWQIDHRFVSGWIHPYRRASQPLRAFDATLYGVTALRHDELPSIVLPSSPPASIAFPFDVGFEMQLGEVSVPERLPVSRIDGARLPLVRIGVSHAAMILDPWRSGVVGRSFEIIIGARYDIDVYGSPTLQTAKVLHRVAPMTATTLRFRTQSDDGLWLLDTRGEVVPHWTSESIWKVAAAGSARVERIVAAVNDEPIAAVLEGGYRLSPGTKDVGLTHEVRVSLGLSFNLSLR
ncbi:MAG: hypothetical protein ABJE95_16975 [Byssovorax sp.]